MTIYLDMDGTIANLYGVPNWLTYLESHDPKPYMDAVPMVHMSTLARYLNKIQRNGFNIGIISWLSKSADDAYNEAVTKAKMAWLLKHLPSVQWDEIHIVPYGVPKSRCASSPDSILFDDEARNCEEWAENMDCPAFSNLILMEMLRQFC